MIAVDLYFLMNAAYDLTLLCVVGIVARKRLYFGRVLAAALFGGGMERNCVNCCSVFCAAVMCIMDCKNDYVSSLPLFNVSHCI